MTMTLSGTTGVAFPTGNTPSMTNYQGGVLTSGTAVLATSGTTIDFTGIPSWAKRVTVSFSNLSTTGSSNAGIQLGTASGIESSGYYGTYQLTTSAGANSAALNPGANFPLFTSGAANYANGIFVFTLIGLTTWACSGDHVNSYPAVVSQSGSKALVGALDRVRIATGNGSDTFDNGYINIFYE